MRCGFNDLYFLSIHVSQNKVNNFFNIEDGNCADAVPGRSHYWDFHGIFRILCIFNNPVVVFEVLCRQQWEKLQFRMLPLAAGASPAPRGMKAHGASHPSLFHWLVVTWTSAAHS